MLLSHLPKSWECIKNILGNIHCIENRWSMFSMTINCSSRMYRLIRLIIFSEQIFLVLCHWRFVPVIHDRKSMLKKMSWEENFKKVTKIFLRLLNKRPRELKVLKIWKSKYSQNLKSQSAGKEEKSFWIMHLMEPKSCNF